MTWGAINELTTLTGYYQLIRRSSHPVLHQMLRRVIQDERRHFAFYRAQAKARMEGNPAAGRIVRRALQAFWTPVGAGVKTQEETDALGLYLMGDGSEEGLEAARGIDETIAELPGLEGLTLIEDYLEAAKRRVAERPGWAGVDADARAPRALDRRYGRSTGPRPRTPAATTCPRSSRPSALAPVRLGGDSGDERRPRRARSRSLPPPRSCEQPA